MRKNAASRITINIFLITLMTNLAREVSSEPEPFADAIIPERSEDVVNFWNEEDEITDGLVPGDRLNTGVTGENSEFIELTDPLARDLPVATPEKDKPQTIISEFRKVVQEAVRPHPSDADVIFSYRTSKKEETKASRRTDAAKAAQFKARTEAAKLDGLLTAFEASLPSQHRPTDSQHEAALLKIKRQHVKALLDSTNAVLRKAQKESQQDATRKKAEDKAKLAKAESLSEEKYQDLMASLRLKLPKGYAGRKHAAEQHGTRSDAAEIHGQDPTSLRTAALHSQMDQTRIAELKTQIGTLRSQIKRETPGDLQSARKRSDLLESYVPQIEQAILKGASLSSVSGLIARLSTVDPERLEPSRIAATIASLEGDSDMDSSQVAAESGMASLAELRKWDERGLLHDSKVIDKLRMEQTLRNGDEDYDESEDMSKIDSQ